LSENRSTDSKAIVFVRRQHAPAAFTKSVHPKINAVSILISDALPFGRLWYDGPNAIRNAIGYAEHYSRSHHAVIRVYDAAGNVIEVHRQKGNFVEP
jgi:hypothetical protein